MRFLKVSISVLMMIACTPVAHAQDTAPTPMVMRSPDSSSPKNRITIAPLSALLGVGNVTYERGLGKHASLQLSPSFLYWGWGDAKLYGGGLGLGASFYITGDAPQGMRLFADVTPGFITAEASSGSSTDGTSSTDSETVFYLQARAMFGYNWAWQGGFTLGIAAGVQYIHVDLKDSSFALNGVLPAADFTLGFVW
ncbi:MAG: hypothetical protein JRH20_26890 [Deltaproteobacteria bacterium]|nr:hypothetical protein [Deltaproteobacteria bacterium]